MARTTTTARCASRATAIVAASGAIADRTAEPTPINGALEQAPSVASGAASSATTSSPSTLGPS
eukprot:4380833-Alexandrium_andersonii.AAC.1